MRSSAVKEVVLKVAGPAFASDAILVPVVAFNCNVSCHNLRSQIASSFKSPVDVGEKIMLFFLSSSFLAFSETIKDVKFQGKLEIA